MIETTQLIIVVLGLISAGSLVVMERMNASRKDEIEMLLNGIASQADRILANYGARLKPVYQLAETAESLIDEETDFAVQYLPAEVIEAAQTVVDFTKRFTDGKVHATGITINAGDNPEVVAEVVRDELLKTISPITPEVAESAPLAERETPDGA